MLPSTKSDQLFKINTSASENWCGYYAIANCLKYKDKNQRNLAYEMIGLNHEIILDSYFLKLKEVFESCKEISVDQYEKLKEQKLSEMITINDVIGEGKRTENDKQIDIIGLKIHKILNNESETREEIIAEYYDNITKPETGFGYQELKELHQKLSELGGSRNYFTSLDTSAYTNTINEQIKVGESKITVSCLEPNLYQKFMGFVLFQKWKEDWKSYFMSEQEQVLDDKTKEECGHDSFISAEVVARIASNLGFEYTRGFEKINERILSKKFSEDDKKLMYIRNPQGVHFTAFVTKSQIANLVNEATERHNAGHNAVAKGGGVGIDSQSPKAKEDDKVTKEIIANLQELNSLDDKHFQFSKRYIIDDSMDDRIVFYKNESGEKILVIKLLDKKTLKEEQESYEFQFNLEDGDIKKFYLDKKKQPKGDAIEIKSEDLKKALEVLENKKKSIKVLIDKLNPINSTQPNPQITNPEARAGDGKGGR